MRRQSPTFFVMIVLTLLAVPGFAETDRVGSMTAAIWCNNGIGFGHLDRTTKATICQRTPAVPGPNQCPEFADRVLLDFATENSQARGRVFVTVQHFGAAGDLLEIFDGVGVVRNQSVHVNVDIDRAMLDGEWLQAEISASKSARKLLHRQCATGSLTVLE